MLNWFKLITLAAIILLSMCIHSCSALQKKPTLPKEVMTAQAQPMEKMTLPEKPGLLDLEGIIQVPAGEWTNKAGRKFSVGQGGGAFLPKKALEELKYKIRLWQYYVEELETELDKGNKRIQEYNDKSLDKVKNVIP